MDVKIKRAYEQNESKDGYRILVDRLWPRGITKEEAKIDLWLKDVGPSTGLRKWFDHDPDKWKEFLIRYKDELSKSAAYDQLKSTIAKQKEVTLIYGAKDKVYNNAAALLTYLKA